MKRPLIIALSGTALIIVTWLHVRPALMSEASIRASLLAQTPIGTSVTEVRALAEKRGRIKPGAGLYEYGIFPVGYSSGLNVTAFGGRLRADPFPYLTEVSATWEFDQSNRLFEIRVSRYGLE